MTKKSFIILGIIAAILLFTTSTFATNMLPDAANHVRNAVGDTENAVEGAVTGTGDMIRSGANTVGNGAKNVVTDVKDGSGTATTGGYTATRTAANGTFAGMSANMWTWLILAIVGAAIIALVWYYTAQNNRINNHVHDDE